MCTRVSKLTHYGSPYDVQEADMRKIRPKHDIMTVAPEAKLAIIFIAFLTVFEMLLENREQLSILMTSLFSL